jgi:hypothetical protein
VWKIDPNTNPCLIVFPIVALLEETRGREKEEEW